MMRNARKSAFVLLFVLVFISCIPSLANAENSIRLYIDGVKVSSEQPPFIDSNTVYVPLSFITNSLGAEVFIDSKNHVSVKVGGKSIELTALIRGGDPFVPIRFISESLGLKVTWDRLTNSVFIFDRIADVKSSGSTYDITGQQVSVESILNIPAPEAGDSSVWPRPAAEVASSDQTVEVVKIQTIVQSGNQLTIGASGSLAPHVFALTEPHRIVIDLPDTLFDQQLNGAPPIQNGEVAVNHPAIAKIRYALVSNNPNTVRIVIDLKQSATYQVVNDLVKHTASITLQTKQQKVVMIDPGHGGHDPGATGVSKQDEKWFTLALSTKVYKLLELEPSIAPMMTRSDDTFVSLDDRAKMANDNKATLFLSIHANTYEGTARVRGTETYYWNNNSRSFANLIHQILIEESELNDRNVRQVEYKVIKNATMPAVLLEMGYISDREEEALLLDDKFQDKLAEAIVKAIKQYLKI